MFTDHLLSFIHVLPACVIIGGEIVLQFIVYPVLIKDQPTLSKDTPLVKIYDILLPIIFAMSLIILGTGMILVFQQYSYFQNAPNAQLIALGTKIGIIALLVSLSAYQTFSLRSKMNGLNPFQKKVEDINALTNKSRTCSIVIITVTVLALFLGTTQF